MNKDIAASIAELALEYLPLYKDHTFPLEMLTSMRKQYLRQIPHDADEMDELVYKHLKSNRELQEKFQQLIAIPSKT